MIDRYMTSTKNVPAIFQKIVEGAAPPRFTSAHLKKLGFKSSNDMGAVGLLKALGFLSEDGAPTERYLSYRDRNRSARVLGAALKEAYPEIFQLNEYPTTSDRAAIVGAITSVLNAEERRAGLIAATFLALLPLADLDPEPISSPRASSIAVEAQLTRNEVQHGAPSTYILHIFQLRKDAKIQLALPPDLTSADVSRLHRWLQTLPLEEAPS
jgi:Family of unknown function (DUF5343)